MNKVPGFSLIEMALVLIIMGLIAGMVLPALKTMVDSQKVKITIQNQEKILYAIASYANQCKYLPYAADPTNPMGTADQATHRRRGIVPYADLGLPETVAKDGYYRWFTYVVDDYYARAPDLSILPEIPQQPMNKLCENPGHHNSLYIKGVRENIALVLISHGPQSRGAYPNHLNPEAQGMDEYQNTTSDREIVDRPISYDPNNPFSHRVVWVTSRNLLAIYGQAPCPPAREIIPQSGGMRYEPQTK